MYGESTLAKLPIVIEPDPRYGSLSPRLRQVAEPIEEVTDELRVLADDMLETMVDADGVGLAAPQVGVLRRLLVVRIPEGYHGEDSPEEVYKLVNPEVIKAGGRDTDLEGCLSFPDLLGEVERYTWAIIRAEDLDGNRVRFRAKGYLARVLQHEIDHLDGILFFDRMDSIGDLFYADELEALAAEEGASEDDEPKVVTA